MADGSDDWWDIVKSGVGTVLSVEQEKYRNDRLGNTTSAIAPAADTQLYVRNEDDRTVRAGEQSWWPVANVNPMWWMLGAVVVVAGVAFVVLRR